jgi:putative ABC transport system permease protein
MESLLKECRYAWRTLLRTPGFTLTVVATLGIGIGASMAIFTVVHALLLRPLPYPASSRMVMVWQDMTGRGGPEREWFTPPDFVDVREQTSSFSALAAVGVWNPTVNTAAGAESLSGAIVSSGYFDVVGVEPRVGAGFGPERERAGATPAVVLSHALWQARFGGEPDIIGRIVHFNDVAHDVVGVMPEGFRDPLFDAQVWRSRVIDPAGPCGRGCYTLRVLGRLKPGVDARAATTDVNLLAARLGALYPATHRDVGFRVVPLKDDLLASTRPALLALAVAVALLLLVAIVNVANLLVARAGVREREVAIRSALGAGRGLLVRQLLVEALVLGISGAVAGGVLAAWAVDALIALAPAGTPRIDEVAIGMTSLAFALVGGILAAVAAALGPALQSVRGGLSEVLKETGGLRVSIGRRRARSALVVAELALALTLLTGAGLTLKSLARLQRVDPGFDPARVLTGFYGVPRAQYASEAEVRIFITSALERIRAIPGVVDVATTSILPMQAGGGDNDTGFLIEGRPLATDETAPGAWYRFVSPNYFTMMGMRMVAGRGFSADDRAGAPAVVVVNEAFQRRHFPGESALGKRLRFDTDAPPAEIVGVVADTRQRGLGEAPVHEMFLPYTQSTDRGVNFMVRTAGKPLALANAVRDAIRELDPALPPPAFRALDDVVTETIALPRLYSAFFTFFAAVALLLAAVGVYGLTAYAVAQRRQEIGVRVALGARARDVVGLIVRQSMTLAAFGVAIGLAAVYALSRPLGQLLFEVSARDAATFAAVAGLLAAIVLVASWLPARRAARIDPAVAMRPE